MSNVKFYRPEHQVPLEMHKVRIVQKLYLLPVEERQKKMEEAGNNTFLLHNKDIYMDMLTDSGVNAMSDNQQAAMFQADDAYAGSETFYRLKKAIKETMGLNDMLPAHQGRACENIIAEAFCRPGDLVPMNFHFTTAKAHITRVGADVVELVAAKGLDANNLDPFKGDFDIPRTKQFIKDHREQIQWLRIETGTNLIGGQPISAHNIKEVAEICRQEGIISVLDASLLQDNLHFIKTREEGYKDKSIKEIMFEICGCVDIVYFSARGGCICSNNEKLMLRMKEYVPLYEGFLTYGGMEVRSMEAIAVGLYETLDEEYINQGPMFIEHLVNELHSYGVPVVRPAGGLGVHLNASEFFPDMPHGEYPAGALGAAMYIAGGIRGMERGTISEQRERDGSERYAPLELLRLAVPRRVFTLSQLEYVADRVKWVWDNRELIGGLRFVEEPSVLRFFFGRLEPVSDWQQKLVKKFRADFGDSL